MSVRLENLRTSRSGGIRFELHGVPASFANSIRRILLAGIPTVVLKDVQILENTSQLPHEMLRHRVQMLPLNVRSSETRIIAETKVELRVPALDQSQEITTRHFTIHGDRKDILLKDDDGNDLLFLRLQPNEGVHVTARLGVEATGESQVSTVSYGFVVDPERAKEDKDAYLADIPEEQKELYSRIFDNSRVQRSYAVDEKGLPNAFDFILESWGVLSPQELLRQALALLKVSILEWAKTPITRDWDGLALVASETETHTVGALVQRVLVDRGKTTRAFYDVPHPLLAKMVVKFETAESPEAVLADAVQTIVGWCDTRDAQLTRGV